MNDWPDGQQALVAQWIEQQFPELKVGSSNLSKGTRSVSQIFGVWLSW